MLRTLPKYFASDWTKCHSGDPFYFMTNHLPLSLALKEIFCFLWLNVRHEGVGYAYAFEHFYYRRSRVCDEDADRGKLQRLVLLNHMKFHSNLRGELFKRIERLTNSCALAASPILKRNLEPIYGTSQLEGNSTINESIFFERLM